MRPKPADARFRNLYGYHGLFVAIGLVACSEDPYERLVRCKDLVAESQECGRLETEAEATKRCEASFSRLDVIDERLGLRGQLPDIQKLPFTRAELREQLKQGRLDPKIEAWLDEVDYKIQQECAAANRECAAKNIELWDESMRLRLRVCEEVISDAERFGAGSHR